MRSQRDLAVYLVTYICMLTYRLAEGYCRKPEGNFLFLDVTEERYSEKSVVNYRCDSGQKTITGGWWSTITCLDGKWSHTPECIDRDDCIPPEVPHAAILPRFQRDSYQSGSSVNFQCNKGYQLQAGVSPRATCAAGDWMSLPICERDKNACSAPPRVEFAAVVNYDYQESFDEEITVEYKCMESYEISGSGSSTCVKGEWTQPGACVKKSDSPAPTMTSHISEKDADRRVTSGTTGRNVGQECLSDPPHIDNGDVISKTKDSATYQCVNFYRLAGHSRITCRQGQWETPPTCQPNFCKVMGKIENLKEVTLPKYLNEGQRDRFLCEKQYYYYSPEYANAECRHGQIHFTGCGVYHWTVQSAP